MMNSDHVRGASNPVLKEPVHRDRLIRLLDDALGRLYPQQARRQSQGDRGQDNPRTRSLRRVQVRYNSFRASIAKFGQFLADSHILEVEIDEPLIRDFERHLSKTGNPRGCLRNHRSQIRKLINALPSGLRQGELGSMAEFKRAHRWDGFSAETPRVLDEFARNGRRLKARCARQAPELSASLLSKPYREQIVKETLTFLRAIQATDILKVAADDVEEFIERYEGNGKKQAALGILDYIHPLFRNLLAKGKIAADPLADAPGKERLENLDYVPQEGMDKLADLATVDMNDFNDVRGRLLCFSIHYDFALRNREGALVKASDLSLAGHTSLVLPKEIQKVQREDSLLFSYFPDVTRPLVERYLELRARKSPATDILVVSDDGMPLGSGGCRLAVKAHCDRLGVKTFEGKTPTPHRLRHSFGSLNIAPLGRCLDIIEVKEQYRHSSIDTTYRLYVAKNAILKTRRYEARMRSNGNGLDPAHPFAVAPAVPPTPSAATAAPFDKAITEDEAIRQVRGLGLNYRPLRAYGIKAGKVRKNGRVYDYSSQFIAGLAGNYFTSQEAMDLLQMPKSTFFAWRNADGVECIQIGQVGLHRKDVILLKKRAG